MPICTRLNEKIEMNVGKRSVPISPMNVIAVPAHTEFIQCYKQALYWMGIIDSPHTRGPMMPLDAPRQEELRAALAIMGVEMVR